MKRTLHFVLCFFVIAGIATEAFSRGSISSRSSGSSFRSSSSSSRSSGGSFFSSKPKSSSTIKSTTTPKSTVPPASTQQTKNPSTNQPAQSDQQYNKPKSSVAPLATGVAVGAAVATASSEPTTAPTTNSSTTTSETKKINDPATATRDVKQSSTIKAPSTTSPNSEKPRAVSMSSLDKKKAKAYASQNKEAASKYGTKASAEKAYRDKLLAQNQFNNPTPPSSKPDYVPQTIVINNTSVNTSYGRLPNGYYGYGYYDPTTNMLVALAANQMMVNEMHMMEEGYGQWDNTGHAVAYHSTPSGIGFFLIFLGIIFVILVIVVLVRKLS